MTEGPDLRKYLEAALVLGRVTKARAEEMLHELAQANEVQREHVDRWVDELVAHGRQAATGALAMFRTEVETIFGESGAKSLEDLLSRLGDLLTPSGSAKAGEAPADAAGTAAEVPGTTGKGTTAETPPSESTTSSGTGAGTAAGTTAPAVPPTGTGS